jgi:hypothetical protein
LISLHVVLVNPSSIPMVGRLNKHGDKGAIALIAALSLWIPFANYGFHGELIGGDAGAIMAYPVQSLQQLLGVYLPGPGLGFNGSLGIQQLFPLLLFMSMLVKLGFSSAVATRLFIAFLFFLSMSGSYSVTRFLIGRRAPRWVIFASMTAALFYGCNNFTVFAYSSAQSTFTMSYSVLPWILFGTIYGIERSAGRGVAIIAAGIVFAGGATNQAQFVVACLVPIIGFIVEIFDGANVGRALAVLVAGFALGTLCCLWWILPVQTVIHAGLGALAAQDVHSWLNWMSARSSFGELFKLAGYTGEARFPYAEWYLGPVGTILGYIPIIVVILTFGRLRPRASIALLLFFLFSAALAKGTHVPFGNAYVFLIDHIPGFSIFRSSYDKWVEIEALTLSCLIGFSIAALGSDAEEPLRRTRARVIAYALAGAVIALPWTLYAGRALGRQANGIGFISQVPRSYSLVASYVNHSPSPGRVVILNSGSLPYPLFRWNYFGQDPLLLLSQKPVTPLDALQENAERLSADRLAFMLKTFGVEFMVVHHDVLNPANSPNIGALVRENYAFPVLSLPDLSLYRLRLTPDPPVTIVHRPIVVGHPDVRAGLTVGSPTTATNAQFAIVDQRSPITVLSSGSIPDAGRIDQAPTYNAGARISVTMPADSQLFFVPNDERSAIWSAVSCGKHQCIRLQSPTTWLAGKTALPSYDAIVPLAKTARHAILYDGAPTLERTSQISLVGVHSLAPSRNIVTAYSFAVIRRGDDIFFRSESHATGSHIDVRVGSNTLMITPDNLEGIAPIRVALVDRNGHERAATIVSSRTLSAVLPRPAPVRPALSLELASRTSRIRVSLEAIPPTIVRGERSVSTISIPHAQGRLDLTRTSEVATLRHGENGVFSLRPTTLRWSTALKRGKPSSTAVLSSRRTPAEAIVSGTILVSDAYLVRLRYRARGEAFVTAWLDGSYARAVRRLIGDAAWHVLEIHLYPPSLSSGPFQIIVEVRHGTVVLGRATIVDIGPNGTFVSLVAGRTFSGSVVSQRRVAPWNVEAQVADCTDCIVALDAADVRNWRVRGANVERSMSGPGAGSSFGMSSGGESLWELRAQHGRATLDFFYEPTALFHRAIWFSFAGLTITALLFVLPITRGTTQVDAPDEVYRFPRMPFSRTLAAFGLAVALVTGAGLEPASEVMGSALWFALIAGSLVPSLSLRLHSSSI